jgi:hypothetical protein
MLSSASISINNIHGKALFQVRVHADSVLIAVGRVARDADPQQLPIKSTLQRPCLRHWRFDSSHNRLPSNHFEGSNADLQLDART